jgi:uncharacterized membrane protein
MGNWINSIIPSGIRPRTRRYWDLSRRDRAQNRAGRSRTREDWAEINSGLTALCGLGVGAGLMYIFDPDRGKRRRALVRDQLVHAGHLITRAIGITSRDLSHRAYGVLAEGNHFFQREEVSNEVLEARVRAKIGRSVSHPHAISVAVNDGRVRLSGQVLANEANRMLSGVWSVRGVKEVEDLLEVHTQAEGMPSLQGGRLRTGDRFALMQSNWSPTVRLLTGLAGGALMANCLARRDPLSAAFGTVGFGLLLRGVTNRDMKSLIGLGRDCRAVEVQKTININAPVESVFKFWTNYQNFPRFMSNVREVRSSGEARSHWIVAGPAGVPVEWTAEITELVPNKLLAWRSIDGTVVNHTGVIHFEPNREDGTRVQIRLCYHPLAGAIGHALAKILGSDPKREMDADLVRMKTFIETGHPPHDAANPSPRSPEPMPTRAEPLNTRRVAQP